MIDLVVFRIETTLLRQSLAWSQALRDVCARFDMHVHPTLIDATRGLPTRTAVRVLNKWPSTQLAEVQREFERALILRYGASDADPEEFGAARCLERLAADGRRVAFESGLSRAVLSVLLERVGWLPRGLAHAAVACDDEVAPVGSAIRRAMSIARVTDPSRVAHVGRSAFDVLAAAEVGTRVRAVVERTPFEGLPFTHVLPHAVLIPELLNRLEAPAAPVRLRLAVASVGAG
jgi:phosphoglycolate phosphatase-like HAD superfamily hydrolase